MRRMLIALLTLVALVGAACGDDGADVADDASPTATVTTEAPTTEPTEDDDDGTCDDQTDEDVVSVEMQDNFFEPACVIAVQSQGLHLENGGASPHTFTITEGDIDFTLQPGEETNVDGPVPLDPGDYAFRCKIHPGMGGSLTLEESA